MRSDYVVMRIKGYFFCSRLLYFFLVILIRLELCFGSGAKFFMYDWPDLVDRYANFTDRDHLSHGVEFPQWKSHGGTGRVVDALNLEHKTSQFGLAKIFVDRARVDPRRTVDPNAAKSFFIPFDVGMHTAFLEKNGRMRKTGCPLLPKVMERLSKSKHWRRNHGHDHFLVFSINYNMNYFMGAKRCTEFMQFCWNCTKLSIDEYLFTARERAFEARNRGINWHAIPFPSDYHFSRLGQHLLQLSSSPSTAAATTTVPAAAAAHGALAAAPRAPVSVRRRLDNSLNAGIDELMRTSAPMRRGRGKRARKVGGWRRDTTDHVLMDERAITQQMLSRGFASNDSSSGSGGQGIKYKWLPPWARLNDVRKHIVSFTGNR